MFPLIIHIFLLIIGFVLLIKGADFFVDSASQIALHFHVSELIIGLTIVAFGTSLPEAAVSITSAYTGTTGIAIGNIIGSNIANVLLILGISGIIGQLTVQKKTFYFEIPYVIVATILLLTLGYFGQSLSFMDGVILWLFFIVFLVYLYHSAKQQKEEQSESKQQTSIIKLLFYVVFSLVCIIVGSEVTVDAARYIAAQLGMSERLIGLTIVAVGTSLPELMTSLVASYKGKNDIAVGNIIGSNIFNILFVLGTASLVAPHGIAFDVQFILDGIIAIGAVVLFMIFIDKDMILRKYGALVMLIGYIIYIISLI